MLRGLAKTKATLMSEVEWLEGVAGELVEFEQSGGSDLPPCLAHYAEVCERMSFYVSIVAGTLQSFNQELGDGAAVWSQAGEETTTPLVFGRHKSDASLLQELLIDASPQPFARTAMHAVSTIITVSLSILKQIAPEVAKFGRGGVAVGGSVWDEEPLLKSPQSQRNIPPVLRLAISLTHLTSNAVHFLKEISSLLGTAVAGPIPAAGEVIAKQKASFMELTRSLLFQGGICESLVEVFGGSVHGGPPLMQCNAAFGADVPHPTLVASTTGPLHATILVNDDIICDRIRGAAAEALFLIVETCGVEVATRSLLLTTLFPDEARAGDEGPARQWRYSMFAERSNSIRRSVLGVLGSLIQADSDFYFSLPSLSRKGSFPKLLMRAIRGDSNIRKGDEAKTQSQCEALACELDAQTLATNTYAHLMTFAQDKLSADLQGEAEHLQFDASAFGGALNPSDPQRTRSASAHARVLWGAGLCDVESFGKVILINLHLCHRIMTSPNTRRLATAREVGQQGDLGTSAVVASCVDLLDATITMLAAGVEFYSNWGSMTGEYNHSVLFYQYCHRVRLLEHLVVLFSRSQASTSDSQTSSFFMVPSPKVVFKAARLVRYFMEHAPPSVALLPTSLLGCDSSTNVVICALEPTSFHSRNASHVHLSPLGGTFGDEDADGTDSLEGFDDPLVDAEPQPTKARDEESDASLNFLRRAQFEVAFSLLIALSRSPLNRRTYLQFLSEQLTPVVCPEAVPRPSYSGDMQGFAAPGAALSQQSREHLRLTCSRALKRGVQSVVVAMVRHVGKWIRAALNVDVVAATSNVASLGALRGVLLQDDSGRCLNDPFNFPEGWSTDEIIQERLLRSTALVSIDIRSRTGSAIKMPSKEACAGFNKLFIPTRTAVEEVVGAQEMRHFVETPATKGEHTMWQGDAFWAEVVEPQRRLLAWNVLALNRTERGLREQHNVAVVVSHVYGILAASVFNCVLSKTIAIARGGRATQNVVDFDSFLTEVSPIPAVAARRKGDDGEGRYHFFDREGRPWNSKREKDVAEDPNDDDELDGVDFVDALAVAEERRKNQVNESKAAVDVMPSSLLQNEFDSAFNLAVDMSDHYVSKVLPHSSANLPFVDPMTLATQSSPHRSFPTTTVTIFNQSRTGLVCGYKKKTLDSTKMKYGPVNIDPRLLHPHHDFKTKQGNMRAWSLKAVQEGDLFFLSIPLQALTATVVDAIIAKARTHQSEAKKAFLTTPTHRKERRWFLYDLHLCIMPRIIAVLQRLNKFCSSQGSQHVQMSISMLPCLKSLGAAPFINASNLVKVVEFLAQYFNKSSLGAPSSFHEGMTVDGVSLGDGPEAAGSFHGSMGGRLSPLHYDDNHSFAGAEDMPFTSNVVPRSAGPFSGYISHQGAGAKLGSVRTPQWQGESGRTGVSLAGLVAAKSAAKIFRSRYSHE